LTELGETW